MTDLHLTFILLPCLYIWSLLKTDVQQSFLRRVLFLKLHSAVLASVQAILLPTMHSQSVIQQETSLTEKVQSFRTDRFHLLHLWMQDQLQLQLPIKDSLHLQQDRLRLTHYRSINTTLILQFIRTEYLIQRVLQILTRKSSLDLTLRIGLRWVHCLRIFFLRLHLLYMILLLLQMNLFHQERLHHSDLIR